MVSKKPLSTALRTFYGIGDTGFSLMTSVELFFFVFFLTNVAQFQLATVAVIGTITSIVDACLSPFYGAIISGTKPLKWGRNRSWMLIAPPFVVILLFFNYVKIGPTETIQAAVICAGFILSHIVWNIAWVANVAMIPLLASNPDERALLASRRATWTAVAGIAFSYVGAPLALWYSNNVNPQLGYALLASTMAFLMMLGYWALFKMTEGYELTGEQAAQLAATGTSQQVTLRGLARSFIQNPPLMILMFADFFRYMGFFIITSSAAYYFTYVAQNMGQISLYMLLGGVGAFIGSYLAAPLTKMLSSRNTTIICGLIGSAIMIVGRFFSMNVMMFFIFMVVARVILGVLTATMVAMYSDAAIFAHWKTGEDASPFVMGLMTVPLKIAIISRGIIIPIMLGIAGFDAKIPAAEATTRLKQAVIDLNILIPAIFTAIAAVILVVAYKLTKEKLQDMQKEIETRAAKA